MTVPDIDTTHIPDCFQPLLHAFATACAVTVRRLCAMAGDVMADMADLLAAGLRRVGMSPVSGCCQPGTLTFQARDGLTMSIRPLNSLSNLAFNGPAGTLSSIRPSPSAARREIMAAGYVLYGPACRLGAGFGQGGRLNRLSSASRRFCPSMAQTRLSGARDRLPAHRPLGHARQEEQWWSGSLVVELHRVMLGGGVFAGSDFPVETEYAPAAFMIEQAGGRATDGARPILDLQMEGSDRRSPIAIGSASAVRRYAVHPAEAEIPALFAHRGLFRGQGGR